MLDLARIVFRDTLHNIKGDLTIWGVIGFLALVSFLPVYSASANAVFLEGQGTTYGHLFKHGFLLFTGIYIMYLVHRIPTNYFKGLTVIAMPIVIGLLIYTLAVEHVSGASARRWISIKPLGLTLQTSTLAGVVLTMWVARYLNKTRDRVVSLKESFVPLWLPVIVVLGLIYSENLSTALMLGSMVYLLCFIGGYPIKNLAIIGLAAAGVIGVFLFLLFNSPEVLPDRAGTWKNRIEAYWNPELADKNSLRQGSLAKLAINEGGVIGKGFGKSSVKNIISQGDSDFIFAIIAGEYGIWGPALLLSAYIIILIRLVVVAQTARAFYSKLLIVCVGFPIIAQALINMGVVAGLLPVTGQPLPLISSGGTSIWITCAALGIVLSATNKEYQKQLLEHEKKMKTAA